MRRERRVEATRPVTTMCGAIKELLLLFHVFSNSIGLKKNMSLRFMRFSYPVF